MPILECADLSKRFGSVQALDNVNFTIEPGRVVGLLGPNGSGKTTLLKLANGLLTPTGGEILIDAVRSGQPSLPRALFPRHKSAHRLPAEACRTGMLPWSGEMSRETIFPS